MEGTELQRNICVLIVFQYKLFQCHKVWESILHELNCLLPIKLHLEPRLGLSLREMLKLLEIITLVMM